MGKLQYIPGAKVHMLPLEYSAMLLRKALIHHELCVDLSNQRAFFSSFVCTCEVKPQIAFITRNRKEYFWAQHFLIEIFCPRHLFRRNVDECHFGAKF